MFIVHNMSALYKRKILSSKDNYAHVIHGSTICNQGVVCKVMKWLRTQFEFANHLI